MQTLPSSPLLGSSSAAACRPAISTRAASVASAQPRLHSAAISRPALSTCVKRGRAGPITPHASFLGHRGTGAGLTPGLCTTPLTILGAALQALGAGLWNGALGARPGLRAMDSPVNPSTGAGAVLRGAGGGRHMPPLVAGAIVVGGASGDGPAPLSAALIIIARALSGISGHPGLRLWPSSRGSRSSNIWDMAPAPPPGARGS